MEYMTDVFVTLTGKEEHNTIGMITRKTCLYEFQRKLTH